MIKKLGYILVILTLVILGGAGWFFWGAHKRTRERVQVTDAARDTGLITPIRHAKQNKPATPQPQTGQEARPRSTDPGQ